MAKRDLVEDIASRPAASAPHVPGTGRPTSASTARRQLLAESRGVVAGLIAEVGRNATSPGRAVVAIVELNADDELALEDGERLIETDLLQVGRQAGNTTSSTVTPAGASTVSSVGMSNGSRGLFDWT